MLLQQNLQTTADAGLFVSAEQTIFSAAQWLRLGVESVGALIVGIGAVLAIYQFVAHIKDEKSSNFDRVRLTLAKYLTLALEFQLGADILSTAIAPSWGQIGKLAAIAAIRTFLNYFLTKEMTAEQKREDQRRAALNDENSK